MFSNLLEEEKKQEAKMAEEKNFFDENIKEVERNHSHGTD